MKRHLLLIFAIVGLALSACKEEPFLSVNPSSLSFEESGGSQTIQVSANYPWTAKVNGSGFSVSPGSGEGEGTVTVTASPATGTDGPSGSVVIFCEGLSASVSLTQAAKSTISAGSGFTAPAEGGTFTVDVQYNVSMKVEVEAMAAGWLKFVQTKALTSGKLEFSVAANDGYDERSAKVTVRDAAGKAAPVEIVVKQEPKKNLEVDMTHIISCEGGILEVDIRYNYDFAVIVGDESSAWIKYKDVKTKAMVNGKLEFEIAANALPEERVGYAYIFDAKSGDYVALIVIVQEGNYPYSSFEMYQIAEGIDGKMVKEIVFNTESTVTTDKSIRIDSPIYYSLSGSTLNLYTEKSSFRMANEAVVQSYFPNLETIDMSKVELHESIGFMFYNLHNLKSVNFGSDRTIKISRICALFCGCTSLETADLSMLDVSDVSDFSNLFDGCSSLRSVNLSGWDTGNATNMSYMFDECCLLEEVDVSSFNTSKVTTMGSMFFDCESLKTLDLSNFDTSSLEKMSIMFNSCMSLTYLDISSFNLMPGCDMYNAMAQLGKLSGKCHVICSGDTFIRLADYQGYVPETVEWEYTTPFELYQSSSYAKDGTVIQLQKATRGKGIDIVLMGDAFSDRLVDNGEYDAALKEAVEAMFSKDPLKSYRDCFNIYEVVAVSKYEYIAYETAFEVQSPMAYYGNDTKVLEYARKALGQDASLDNVLIGVLTHTILGGGTAYIPVPYGKKENDYGVGQALVYFGCSLGLDRQGFVSTVLHEIVGHGFAKLDDEYSPTYGKMPKDVSDRIAYEQEHYGFWKNMSTTPDPSKVGWSKFMSDPRYAGEDIGIYEGGSAAFTEGVWRSSYNSIMNQRLPASYDFNAPSREAIYYRLNKLVYGEDWEYDYETFVKFDLKL